MRYGLVVALSLASSAQVSTQGPPRVGPTRGTVILASAQTPLILARFIELAGGPDSAIVLVPTAALNKPGGAQVTLARSNPPETALKAQGAKNVTVLHTFDRTVADSDAFVEPITRAAGVWFAGGMPEYLLDSYADTKTVLELRKALERGARGLAKFGSNPSRHGWDGWLTTERSVPRAAFRDRDLRNVILESARAALEDTSARSRFRVGALSNNEADPNDWRIATDESIGIRYTPLTTRNGVRIGSRERLLEVSARHPDRLRIQTHALATRVLLDDQHRAVGVEYLHGERLYRAHPHPTVALGERRQVHASREVILAGGAFNTPQLLMLSGIGPRDVLERHGIAPRVPLAGVGRNLQDRYEVSVVNRMAFDAWSVLRGATYTRADAQYAEWSARRQGVFTTNGSLFAVVMRSSLERAVPDLFCYSVLAPFKGYYPRYSADIVGNPNCLSWVILKGHTNNTAGEVTLRSADPRDPPDIRFRYFEEGTDAAGDDLTSVVDGIRFVRTMTGRLAREGLIEREEVPGPQVESDDDLRQFVRDHAWGHHASCTCPIGRQEHGGVVSASLQVHGTSGLRVVDASVFPRIPGLFIASAVYMVGEKAADMMAADARP